MGTSYTWSNPSGGKFDDAGNWVPNAVPGAQDSATFDLGETYTVSDDGTAGYILVEDAVTFTGSIDAAQLSSDFTAFEVGDGGSAVFKAGTLYSPAEARIGDNLGSGTLSFIDGATGTLTATDAANALDVAFADDDPATSTSGLVSVDGSHSALTLLGGAYIGADGAGTLAISDDGLVQLLEESVGYTELDVGEGGSATGLVTVTSGGTLSVGELTAIGDAGQGTVDFSDGAVGSFAGTFYSTADASFEDSYAVYLGGSGGSGTLSVDGDKTSVTADEGLLVGQYGTGELSITNGATFTIDGPSGGSFDLTDVGASTGAHGTLIVSGSAEFNTSGLLEIGAEGYGSLDIDTGGTVHSDELSGDVSGELGGAPGGVGVGVIDDGLWDAEQAFSVGYQGDGTLTVQDGGTLEVDGTFLRVGRDPGSSGTLTVDNAIVSAPSAELTVGPAATNAGDGTGGNGLLEIEALGTAVSSVTVDDGVVGDLAGGTGSIDVNAGVGGEASLTFLGDLSTGAGTSTLTAENGGIAASGSIVIGGGGGAAFVELTNFGGLYDYGGGTTLGALGTLALDSTAYLYPANGTTTAPLTLDGGTFDVLGDGSLRDPIALDVTGGSTAEPSAIIGAATADVVIGDGITFDGTGTSVLLLGPGYDTNNAISDFGAGDTLDVQIAAGDVFNTASYDVSTDTLTLSEADNTLSLHIIDNGYSANSFEAVSDDSGGTYVYLESGPPCFCRGTLILTEDGEVPVEALQIGDRVATRMGLRSIKWIGQRGYDGRFIRGQHSVLPIVVSAGAIAHGVPARDLWVSPDHALYLDGVLVPAKLLVNGMTISQVEAVDWLEYFHIELDTHDVLFADGAPAETYIECDNRLMFHNAAEFAALYPEALPDVGRFYAPRLEDGATALTAIRARLLGRAAALGHQVTGDPGLHLIADGVAVDAVAVEDGIYRFALEHPARAVYLASRSAVPAETDAASIDRRRLGVCLRRITLRGADFTLDLVPGHHLLRDGFHEAEGEHRWTAGMARLPTSVIDLFAGRLDIEIAVWSSELRYAERAA